MDFNEHYNLKDLHSQLSPSNYHWMRYTPDKMELVWRNKQQATLGSELHLFASEAIRLRQKLQGNKTTIARYVNDAIGYRMTPEQVLFVSGNAFGTADAIGFKNNLLRIHDLKTGIIPGNMDQLMVYAAFFCLEYKVDPFKIAIELRIYQDDDVVVFIPPPEEIRDICKVTLEHDKLLDQLNQGV